MRVERAQVPLEVPGPALVLVGALATLLAVPEPEVWALSPVYRGVALAWLSVALEAPVASSG